MKSPITSIPALENALIKLNFKKKKFEFEVIRLEYRIWQAMTKLEKVNTLIKEEEENISSLELAIAAIGEGFVKEKLTAWKIKAEYKLFKYKLRKNKIDVIKLVLNQSKFEQATHALKVTELDISQIEKQMLMVKMPIIIPISNNNGNINNLFFNGWDNINRQRDTIADSIDKYVREYLKMAS